MSKRRTASPLAESLRRTPPQLVSVEMQRQQQLLVAKGVDRELQQLLELDYRDDVKVYMYEMEVSLVSDFDRPLPLPRARHDALGRRASLECNADLARSMYRPKLQHQST